MAARPIIRRPNKPYPRDVTSPGPDQQRGVVKSQRTGSSPAVEPCLPAVPKKGGQPKQPGEGEPADG